MWWCKAFERSALFETGCIGVVLVCRATYLVPPLRLATAFHGSSLPQPSAPRESGSQVKARSVLDHPRTCRGEAQAPTQVDVCKASTDTVVSHKLSRNADSPSRRTNGSLPDPGSWKAVRLLNSDSFGTCIPWCNQSNFPPDQPESRFFAVLVASVCAEPSERMEVEQNVSHARLRQT